MKAAFLAAPGRIELQDIDYPEPGASDVVIRVVVALTDGTDLKAFRRGHPKLTLPSRFGHEFAGEVVAVGREVTKFAIGDRVASIHTAPCLSCYWCRAAQEELCATIMDRMLLGAYSEALCIPQEIIAQNMYHLPADVSFESAAFLEPLACVVHAWENIQITPETTVAIHGLGGFGMLHAMVARALGVQNIYLIGRSALPLVRAAKLQLGEVIDAMTIDARIPLLGSTDGRGADIVIECTGAREVWESSLRLVRRGGVVILFGGLPNGLTVRFDAARLHYDEILLRSPFHLTPRSVKRAFDMIVNGTVDPRPLITSSYPLHEIQAAFNALDDGRELKIAIRPEQTQ